MCIAVGNVSFDDWLMFTSSFGWRMFFPARAFARFAITSFTFIFVCVPLPVCHTTSGNSAANFPLQISSHTLSIPRSFSVLILCGRSCAFARAAAFFSTPKAWIISAGIVSIPAPILKFCLLRSVCAPQYASFGTKTSPIESCSLRYSMPDIVADTPVMSSC